MPGRVYNSAADALRKTWKFEGIRGVQRGLGAAVRISFVYLRSLCIMAKSGSVEKSIRRDRRRIVRLTNFEYVIVRLPIRAKRIAVGILRTATTSDQSSGRICADASDTLDFRSRRSQFWNHRRSVHHSSYLSQKREKLIKVHE